MDASLLQKGSKREMMVTPFASQFDEIETALFEYRYRKQSQHHHFNNNNNNKHTMHTMQSGQRNHHGHQAHRQQSYQHYYAPQQQQQSYGSYGAQSQHVMVQSRSSLAPAPVSQQQQQQQHQQAYNQQPQPSLMAQQYPATQNMHSPAGVNHIYGMANGSTVARSPDSFVEGLGASMHGASSNKFDGFSLNLSSSISSGAGSTSSYSSYNEYEMQNKLPAVSAYSSSLKKTMNYTVSQDGARSNELNVVNENNGFENFTNVTNTSNRGWLNIWGNDMSVWG